MGDSVVKLFEQRYWEAVWASGYSCGNGLFKYLFNMNALILNVSGIRAVQNPLDQ